MSSKHYDVLIIGGGIHGVGVAQAAAAAGYRVLVLEQGELASGTSSRSSKLIHGGLRYLEHGQFSLVRECLRERALLLKNAPDLVRLQPFFIPVYDDSVRSRWLVRLGLMLYSMLGGGGPDTRFRSLSHREWAELDGLSTTGLRAVFQYQDAQTDDAALTHAVMASAKTLGAQLKTHSTFLAAAQLQVAGREQWDVQYQKNNQQHQCTAEVIVNAAGAWANEVLARINTSAQPVKVELVQGTHLLLEGRLERGVYYLQSPRDQRPVFAMPWQTGGEKAGAAILLGTTETRFSGQPADVRPLPAEQEYLLETYHHYFSTTPQVREAFAGLRVLPFAEKQQADQFTAHHRETVLQTDSDERPSVLTIYGGKLTAYRATAEKVVRLLQRSLPHREPIADTRTLKLETTI